ncbi:hypothetical protein AMECASPLE_018296 [Ameca splendens]|uniref:Chemokine interleukin-8-like domain-containing protein n=1 Tax=Ameca splendens TaxID=208324 RepID=A0ABV0ZZ09_9TELE
MCIGKMWWTLPLTRWIFLLSLAVVMLLSVTEVESLPANIILPCCRDLTSRIPAKIAKCYEQKSRRGCRTHAIVITDHKKHMWCIKPSKWLNDMKEKKHVKCPPDISVLS